MLQGWLRLHENPLSVHPAELLNGYEREKTNLPPRRSLRWWLCSTWFALSKAIKNKNEFNANKQKQDQTKRSAGHTSSRRPCRPNLWKDLLSFLSNARFALQHWPILLTLNNTIGQPVDKIHTILKRGISTHLRFWSGRHKSYENWYPWSSQDWQSLPRTSRLSTFVQ